MSVAESHVKIGDEDDVQKKCSGVGSEKSVFNQEGDDYDCKQKSEHIIFSFL